MARPSWSNTTSNGAPDSSEPRESSKASWASHGRKNSVMPSRRGRRTAVPRRWPPGERPVGTDHGEHGRDADAELVVAEQVVDDWTATALVEAS